jgi:hypothetical protein
MASRRRGATWPDYRLGERQHMPLAMSEVGKCVMAIVDAVDPGVSLAGQFIMQSGGEEAPDDGRRCLPAARRRACGSPSLGLSGRRSMKPMSLAVIQIVASRRVQRSASTSRSGAAQISCSGLGPSAAGPGPRPASVIHD